MDQNISNVFEEFKNMPNGIEKSKLYKDVKVVLTNKKYEDGKKIKEISNIITNIKKGKYLFGSRDDQVTTVNILNDFVNSDYLNFDNLN